MFFVSYYGASKIVDNALKFYQCNFKLLLCYN